MRGPATARLDRSLSLLLAGAALAVAGVGCGSGAEADSSFGEILSNLRSAALAGKVYKPVRQTGDLDRGEKAVLESFCEFAWQIDVNREAAKLSGHPYVIGRIVSYAEVTERAPHPTVEAAMDELESVIDLGSLNADLVRRYTKACDR
jgi:hypothetical protein